MTAPRYRDVRLSTDLGDIVVRLDLQSAPLSCADFLCHVEQGLMARSMFVRSVSRENDRGHPPIAVIQATLTDTNNAFPGIPHESTEQTGLRHRDGTLSLARAEPGTGSASSFFICIGDQPGLDAASPRNADGLGFAAFGRVVSGMEVVRAIHASPRLDDAPHEYLRGQLLIQPVAITTAEVIDSVDFDSLCDRYWAFRLHEFPTEASYAGEHAYDHLLERSSPDDHRRRACFAAELIGQLNDIDADALDANARMSFALLRGQLEVIRDAWQLDHHLMPRLFPFSFVGLPDDLAMITTLTTLVEYRAFIERLSQIKTFFEDNIACLELGILKGYRLPAVIFPRVAALIESYLADDTVAKKLKARFACAPAGVSEDEFGVVRKQATSTIDEVVVPALRSVLDWLRERRHDLCTDSIAVTDRPEGRDYYRFLVRQQTSTNLDPDVIHDIGLGELERLRQETRTILDEIGFTGDGRSYATHLNSTDIEGDAEQLLQKVRALSKIVDGKLPSIFGTFPRTTYAVEQLSMDQSLQLPPAFAMPGPADRSAPGVYWLTALPSRCPNYMLVPITLHEAWPGHLMQIARAQEIEDLPAFRRHSTSDYNGYIEGWALYCERLGVDLGLYDEPRDVFGRIGCELWRAARLVVDTGIHWKGWSRDQAIACMLTNTFLPEDTVAAEVDRYIAMPAQALSYKLGECCFRSIRAKAEAALGEHFSLRNFHDALLETGAVSLTALEQYMEEWINVRR